jgi:osmotically-inducible protein OsmY
LAEADCEINAMAAEAVPGVKAVEDHLQKTVPILYWNE